MASLVAPEYADPFADAEHIRKAVKGFGTDEKSVISIIAHRNASQRKQIKEAYHQLYDEDLLHRFEKEFSHHFERATYRWMLDTWDREAVIAHVALKNKDYHVIVEISCAYSSEELLGIRRAYQARYKHSLEEDVASYTTGYIRKLLVFLVSAYRHETEDLDAALAEIEAGILQSAIENNDYHNDEVLRIVTTRSRLQLVTTFYHFETLCGDPIYKVLPKGDDLYVELLKITTHCIKDAKDYFEQVLSHAIEEGEEDELTRVVVTRAERDLALIKELYYEKKSVTLDHAIDKKFHGDYKHFLIALIGTED